MRQQHGESVVSRAIHYRENCAVLDDLDIRASDILQANGVIWVEGPSDRLYLRRWIDLVSDGLLREGTHYSIMYYGGKLLSHLSLAQPGTAEQLIAILSINRNAGVLIDSDRKPATGERRPKYRLNDTKQRIKSEVEGLNGYVWITEGREVENYIPPAVLGRLIDGKAVPIDIYDPVIEAESLAHFKKDKIELASRACESTNKADMVGHLDLTEKVEALCCEIRRWNHIRAA